MLYVYEAEIDENEEAGTEELRFNAGIVIDFVTRNGKT